MTKEHPLMGKARNVLGLSDAVDCTDAVMRSIERANASHYTDSLPPIKQVEIKVKADIANSKHRASPEAIDKLNGLLKGRKGE
jgi:hypothetical protein